MSRKRSRTKPVDAKAPPKLKLKWEEWHPPRRRLRLLCDEHLPREIAAALRAHVKANVRCATDDPTLKGLEDDQLLALAQKEKRILVTQNVHLRSPDLYPVHMLGCLVVVLDVPNLNSGGSIIAVLANLCAMLSDMVRKFPQPITQMRLKVSFDGAAWEWVKDGKVQRQFYDWK